MLNLEAEQYRNNSWLESFCVTSHLQVPPVLVGLLGCMKVTVSVVWRCRWDSNVRPRQQDETHEAEEQRSLLLFTSVASHLDTTPRPLTTTSIIGFPSLLSCRLFTRGILTQSTTPRPTWPMREGWKWAAGACASTPCPRLSTHVSLLWRRMRNVRLRLHLRAQTKQLDAAAARRCRH